MNKLTDKDRIESHPMNAVVLEDGAIAGTAAFSVLGSRFNPGELVAAVNDLVALDKDKQNTALQGMAASSNGLDHNLRVFLICRLLFVQGDGNPPLRPMMLGGSEVSMSKVQPEDWPLFPLALRGDIPFLLTEAYTLAGIPEDPVFYIQYCIKNATIRAKPLFPRAEDARWVAEQLASEEKFRRLFGTDSDHYSSMILRQAERFSTK